MLAIRLKRTGRTGHAQFRVVIQDSHFHPTRGRVVAYAGSYDPHTKATQLDKELVKKYLNNGAQPSDRVAKLLKDEGIKLPDWVKVSSPQKRTIRNTDKLRRNRPAEEKPAEAKEAPTEEEVPTKDGPAEPAETTEVKESPAETNTVEAEEVPSVDPKA